MMQRTRMDDGSRQHMQQHTPAQVSMPMQPRVAELMSAQQPRFQQQQPQQQQQNGENMRGPQQQQLAILNQKLVQQSKRVVRWKTQAEMELQKREEKVNELEATITRQHNNMLNQQSQCEALSHRLQAELIKQQEIRTKVDNTRHICTLLQNHCLQLSKTLQRCVDEKQLLKEGYDQQLNQIEELSAKFDSLSGDYNTDLEHHKQMLAEERQARENNVHEAKSIKEVMEQRLEAAGAKLRQECERAEQLHLQQAASEAAMRALAAERDCYIQSLSETKQRLEEVQGLLTAEKRELQRDVQCSRESLDHEKAKVEELHSESAALLAQLQATTQQRDEALSTCALQGQENESLQNLLEDRKKETARLEGEVASLETERNELHTRVAELESLREDVAKLRISLYEETARGSKDREELELANQQLHELREAVRQSEELLRLCEENRESSARQAERLQAANHELETRLAEANQLVDQLQAAARDLKLNVESKSGEVSVLQCSLEQQERGAASVLQEKEQLLQELSLRLEEKARELRELSVQHEGARELLRERERQMEERTSALSEQGALAEERGTLLAAREQEVRDLRLQMDTMQEHLTQLETKGEILEQETARLRELLEGESSSGVHLSTLISEREQQLAEAGGREEALQARVATLEEEVDRSLREQQATLVSEHQMQVTKLNEQLSQSLQKNQANEAEMTTLRSQLDSLESQMSDRQRDLEAVSLRAEEERAQLEDRLEKLRHELTRVCEEKNKALAEHAAAVRDKRDLQDRSNHKLQELTQSLEQNRRLLLAEKEECHSASLTRLEREIEEARAERDQAISRMGVLDRQLADTVAKNKDFTAKQGARMKRYVEKSVFLEKKLRNAEHDLRQQQQLVGLKQAAVLLEQKSPSTPKRVVPPPISSPRTPKMMAPPVPVASPAHTPTSAHRMSGGVPPTPRILKKAESSPAVFPSTPTSRGILKTPPAPSPKPQQQQQQQPRKRPIVMQSPDESSDTDASTVDILVIDERETLRRLNAARRGGKLDCSRMPLVRSPGNPVAQRGEGTPIQPSKKLRFMSPVVQVSPSATANLREEVDRSFGFDD